ncbi:MAG: hydrogenase maturation protease [Ectothiorhodospiraceae bacterium]|nr:hydrogenase maturation protease [Ectothiorhodospiraceae bacterium]
MTRAPTPPRSGVRRVRVIGLGSPLGDDRVGWEVVDGLLPHLGPGAAPPGIEIEVLALDRPGADLGRHLADADLVVLVDALVDGGPAGRVRRLTATEVAAASAAAGASTHGFGVAEALRLAAALDPDGPSIWLVGIGIAGGRATPEASLSTEVAAAVGIACRMVVDTIRAPPTSDRGPPPAP